MDGTYDGGTFYGDFVRNNYIAIEYNDLSLESLNNLPEGENSAKEVLKILFSDKYPNIRNTGYPVSQLLHFVRNINVGDIVIIPSVSATHVAIGVVKGDMYEEEYPILDDEHRCHFKKRRKVEWLLARRRSQLPPALQLMFSSRHILSDVTNYAPYIDSVTNDCYVKDDEMHLVLRINTKNEVSLDDFCDLKAINHLINHFCQNTNYNWGGFEVDNSPIVMKVQMESPGWLRLSTKNIGNVLLFGIFLVAISGGGIQYKTEDGFKMYTNGIPGAINDYLDREADRELVRAAARAIDSLKINSPKDLEPIIKMLDTKNQGRDKY